MYCDKQELSLRYLSNAIGMQKVEPFTLPLEFKKTSPNPVDHSVSFSKYLLRPPGTSIRDTRLRRCGNNLSLLASFSLSIRGGVKGNWKMKKSSSEVNDAI